MNSRTMTRISIEDLKELAKRAWVEAASMEVFADSLLERGLIVLEPRDVVERRSRLYEGHSAEEEGLYYLECRAREWILCELLDYFSMTHELRVTGGWGLRGEDVGDPFRSRGACRARSPGLPWCGGGSSPPAKKKPLGALLPRGSRFCLRTMAEEQTWLDLRPLGTRRPQREDTTPGPSVQQDRSHPEDLSWSRSRA